MKVTGSSMGRAEACPPSTFLPRIDEVSSRAAERGRAIHSFLCAVATKGRDAALAEAPEEFLADVEAIDLETLPHSDPGAWAVEVGLAWDYETDTGRELFRAIETRDYSGAGPTEICGTADVLGVTADSVIVLDVKTGFAPLGPPATALQLLFYAVAAARAFGKSSALVGWIRLRDGVPYFERAFVDMLALDAAAARMKAAIDAALSAELLFSVDPSTLAPVVGPHCIFCPAYRVCPANVSLLGELAHADGKLELPVLDATTAPRVLLRAEAMQKVLDLVFKTLEGFAESQPFDLPDGTRYGRTATTRETIDAMAALPVLRALPHEGAAVADAAVEVQHITSKAALARALKAHKPPGVKITHYQRDVLQALRDAGAAKSETYYSVKRFKPKPQLEPAEVELEGTAA